MTFSAALARLRLLDGLIVAAVALLALKGIGFVAGTDSGQAEPPAPFAQVLAHARTNYVPPDPATTGSVPDKAKSPAAASAETAPARTPDAASGTSGSPAGRALAERLAERREALQQQAREAETRERLLEESERRIEARLGEIRASEEKRAAAATPADTEATALKSLVVMYETMKPKEAARVFDRLPQDVLVPVARSMNPRKMAEVLAAMTPENAEKLTVALARRAKAGGSDDKGSGVGLPAGELQAIEPPAR